MHKRIVATAFLVAGLPLQGSWAAESCVLSALPQSASIPGAEYASLSKERSALQAAHDDITSRADKFNVRCGIVEDGTDLDRQCAAEYKKLNREIEQRESSCRAFNARIANAARAPSAPKGGEKR